MKRLQLNFGGSMVSGNISTSSVPIFLVFTV